MKETVPKRNEKLSEEEIIREMTVESRMQGRAKVARGDNRAGSRPGLMKTTGPGVIKGPGWPGARSLFHWLASGAGCARGPRGRSCGGPKSSVISERLMVASRCFIIFSKCKFVHGPRAVSLAVSLAVRGPAPAGRGGPYKTRDRSSRSFVGRSVGRSVCLVRLVA